MTHLQKHNQTLPHHRPIPSVLVWGGEDCCMIIRFISVDTRRKRFLCKIGVHMCTRPCPYDDDCFEHLTCAYCEPVYSEEDEKDKSHTITEEGSDI